MARYSAQYNGGLPAVPPFPPPPAPSSAPDEFEKEPPGPPARATEQATPKPAPRDGTRQAGRTGQSLPNRTALLKAAAANNKELVAALRTEPGLTGNTLADLPVSVYDQTYLRDAWGSPVVFMRSKHPLVGTAPQDRFFFFSAGPDCSYLTQNDNLYSYDPYDPKGAK
jgi:hypothetical protein